MKKQFLWAIIFNYVEKKNQMTIEINDFFIKKKKKLLSQFEVALPPILCVFSMYYYEPPISPPPLLPPFLLPLPPLPLPIFANYYYYTLLLQKMNLYELCVMNDVW